VKAKNLCLDGYVHFDDAKYYIERIQIDNLSIEGYGSQADPNINTYIQTRLASRDTTSDIWLRLQQPASRYERFHSPFSWVAVLGKHVLDYMDEQPKNTVSLESFENDFHRWLARRFGSNEAFKEWHATSGGVRDFRVAFNAYAEFFYIQALNLSTARHLTSHTVWSHCKVDRMTAIEIQPNLVKDTLTTPDVYENFKHMYFARKLKEVTPATSVSKMQKERKERLVFADDDTHAPSSRRRDENSRGVNDIQAGEVVSINPDDTDRVNWQKSENEWLAYVQDVEPARNGGQRLIVLWLYRPADTNLCLAKYRFSKELFLSDNCNCGEREIMSTDVIRKHDIAWSPRSLNTDSDYFIRQTYITHDSAFVAVKDDHKMCACRKPKSNTLPWSAGDTVYITKTINGQKTLEPVVIHQIDDRTKEAKFRALLRLKRDCSDLILQAGRSNIAPNELVLTDKLKVLPTSRIQRACHVIFVHKTKVLKGEVPFPYNLRGAGDHWYISMGLNSANDTQQLVYLEELPRGFREAREEPFPRKRLKGLSLFSGGGGLDRGLEEGGAVEFRTSVDYDSAAIHTQRANCQDPQNMRLFCGSVDDYLNKVLSGHKNRSVARVGEVEVVAAGSPCPGMSLTTLPTL
jgi:DNA (cytosine-5)-methyltransferase 1